MPEEHSHITPRCAPDGQASSISAPQTSVGATAQTTEYRHISAGDGAIQHSGAVYGNVTNYYGPANVAAPIAQRTGNQHWVVKRRPNALFTGQDAILAQIESDLLAAGQSRGDGSTPQFVLQGIGGLGKSELALQFAKRHRQVFWGVFWVDFGSEASTQLSFQQIAKACGWPADGDSAADEVIDRLSNTDCPWLLILDNCDDPDKDYDTFFPAASAGAVIMTTRLLSADVFATAGKFTLTGLDIQTSVELLYKTAKISKPPQQALAALVEQLGYHTLAIIVAGSIVRSGMHSIETFSNVLREKQTELLTSRPRQAQSTYGTVHATFEITAEKLCASNEPAARHAMELLSVLAYLDHKDIPEVLFSRAWKWSAKHYWDKRFVDEDEAGDVTKLSKEILSQATGYEWASPDLVTFRRARACLYEVSLISLSDKEDSMSMHPLLHAWARNRLRESEQTTTCVAAAATLAISAECALAWRTYTSSLLPHIETCFQHRLMLHADGPSNLQLCRILLILYSQSRAAHSRMSTIIFHELDTLAERLTERTATKNKITLLRVRAQHFQDIGNLTTFIYHQQRLVEALSLELSPEHVDVVSSKWALEAALHKANRHDEAARVRASNVKLPSLQGLDTRLTSLYLDAQATNPDTKLTPEQTISFYAQALQLQRNTAADTHPTVIISCMTLAASYMVAEQVNTAIKLLEEMLPAVESPAAQQYGAMYRLTYKQTLAQAFCLDGQTAKGIAMLHAIQKEASDDLPATDGTRLSIQFSLANMYVQQADYKPAVAMLRTLLESCDGAAAIVGFDIYNAEYLLCSCFILLGEVANAREILNKLQSEKEQRTEAEKRRISELEARLTGHADSLAIKYLEAGRLAEGIAVLEVVVACWARTRPPDCRYRRQSERRLVQCYFHAKQPRKARTLLSCMTMISFLLPAEDQRELLTLQAELETVEATCAVEAFSLKP